MSSPYLGDLLFLPCMASLVTSAPGSLANRWFHVNIIGNNAECQLPTSTNVATLPRQAIGAPCELPALRSRFHADVLETPLLRGAYSCQLPLGLWT